MKRINTMKRSKRSFPTEKESFANVSGTVKKTKSVQNRKMDLGKPKKPSNAPESVQSVSKLDSYSSDDDVDDLPERCGSVALFQGIFANVRKQLTETSAQSKHVAAKEAEQKTRWDLEDIDPNKFDSDEDNDGNKKYCEKGWTEQETTSIREPSSAEKACQDARDLLRSLDSPEKKKSSPRKVRKLELPAGTTQSGTDVFILDDDESFDMGPYELTIEPFNVRVRWHNEIKKFRMLETDLCYELKRQLAQSVSLTPNDILIYFNNEVDTFEDSKTLKAANVVLGTVLEASRNVPMLSRTGTSSTAHSTRDPNDISLKLQITDKSFVILEINKNCPLRDLRAKYAIQMNLSIDQVKFRFDGDLLDLDETPADLDLEADECIDVIIT